MLLSRVVQVLLAATIIVAGALHAQDYPRRPVRILSLGPGGTSDFTSRLIAAGISGPMGQSVYVENRGGFLTHEAVAKAAPDGYTLLIGGGNFWIGPLIQKMSFDPVKDFSPVIEVVTSPAVLVTNPALPVKSVGELIALAKTRPGALNVASSNIGGAAHLAAALFDSMAQVQMTLIPYKAGGESVTDLLSGHVQLSFAQIGNVAPLIKAGRLNAIAVTSAQPSALFPGVPTMAATLPGYEAANFLGIFAPANTPASVISKLNQEIARFIAKPETKEQFKNAGFETVGGTPDELGDAVKADIARNSKLLKSLNISPDQSN